MKYFVGNQMQILKSVKTMLYFMGLLFNYENNHYYTFYTVFWFLATTIYIIPEITYFYVYMNDLLKATDVLIFLAIKIMTAIKMCVFHLNKNEYRILVDNVQKNSITRTEQNHGKHYAEAEKLCTKFCKFYYSIYLVGTHLGLILPLIVVLYNYILGHLTPDIWYLPFPGILFFDTETSPGFQVAYGIIVIALVGLVFNYLAIDSLFVGMCVYLRAGYRDLQDMLGELNDYYATDNYKKDDSISLFHANDNELELLILDRNIGKCIEFQKFLTECHDKIEKLNSGIIFAQFSGTVFIICATLFQMSISLESGKYVTYINLYFFYLLQLFVYACSGNMVTSEINNLSNSIYNSIWYRRPPKCRNRFYLMIMKAQTIRYFRGIKYLNCSMESFTKVLRAAGSTFALLQSMTEKS